MSSILLSNPFVAPAAPPVNNVGGALLTVRAAPPSTSGAGTSDSGDSRSSSGGGFGNQNGAQVLIMRTRPGAWLDRPVEAASRSVVNAQVFERSPDPFGTNLPNVDMPDPLPTSPYLLPARRSA
jgi:hypothetical protein